MREHSFIKLPSTLFVVCGAIGDELHATVDLNQPLEVRLRCSVVLSPFCYSCHSVIPGCPETPAEKIGQGSPMKQPCPSFHVNHQR